MKKLIYIAAVSLLIAACGKENATPNYIDNRLVGTWELTECYMDFSDSEINIDNAKNFTKIDENLTIIFTADTACGFTYTFINEDFARYNYNAKNNNITLTKLCERQLDENYYFYDIPDEIIYKLNNSNLIIANKYRINSAYNTYYSFYKRKS
jgi:hypothetical protein